MNELLLVAILTLPNTNRVVYEVQGAYPNQKDCITAKHKQQQQQHTVKTGYMCLKADKN